jgi:transposase InsO family protein
VITDNGNEFRTSFDQLLERRQIRHTRIRPGRPQTNGHVERLHKTILDECWRPSFARYLHIKYGGLRRDLAEYLQLYTPTARTPAASPKAASPPISSTPPTKCDPEHEPHLSVQLGESPA